jgi:hypothetical protein
VYEFFLENLDDAGRIFFDGKPEADHRALERR